MHLAAGLAGPTAGTITVLGGLRAGLASRGMSQPAASAWLAQHHYTLWVSYQPASRFWSFQLVEGAGLLVLALLMGAAALWTVRRRA